MEINIFAFFSLFSSIWLEIFLLLQPTTTTVSNSSTISSPVADSVALPFPILLLMLSAIVTGLFYSIVSFFKLTQKSKITHQYHAAEHKIIFVNDARRPLTLKNCRRAPRTSDYCGTMLACIYVLVYAFYTILIHLLHIPNIFSLSFFISYAIAYEIFYMDSKLPGIRLIYKIGYWFQKHLFTREPSNLQLEQAIEAFKLLEKAEKGQIPEDKLQELLQNGKKMSFVDKII